MQAIKHMKMLQMREINRKSDELIHNSYMHDLCFMIHKSNFVQNRIIQTKYILIVIMICGYTIS
jgi:hypothetical protein